MKLTKIRLDFLNSLPHGEWVNFWGMGVSKGINDSTIREMMEVGMLLGARVSPAEVLTEEDVQAGYTKVSVTVMESRDSRYVQFVKKIGVIEEIFANRANREVLEELKVKKTIADLEERVNFLEGQSRLRIDRDGR